MSRLSGDTSQPPAELITRGRLTMEPERHRVTWDGHPVSLTVTEFLILEALAQRPGLGYRSACFGKWHLNRGSNGGADNPNLMGFDHYVGPLRGVSDYFDWQKVTNGSTSTVTSYATSEVVDDALQWIGDQGDQPWFAWVAFSAPHTPFHLPPAHLHSYNTLTGTAAHISANPELYYQAAIEAMDTEIGRLLSILDPDVLANTTIIYMGDNGTPGQVGPGQTKGFLYEGGVHVPFVISGADVLDGGREVDSIVDVTDVYATVLQLAGVDVAATTPPGVTMDSVSLLPYLADPSQLPVRTWALAERFGPNTPPTRVGKAIRDDQFKLLRFDNQADEFYDLDADPTESSDLLDNALSSEAQSRLDALNATLDALLTAS